MKVILIIKYKKYFICMFDLDITSKGFLTWHFNLLSITKIWGILWQIILIHVCILSENIKYICKSFGNSKKNKPLASFSGLFCRILILHWNKKSRSSWSYYQCTALVSFPILVIFKHLSSHFPYLDVGSYICHLCLINQIFSIWHNQMSIYRDSRRIIKVNT
jgi:hypothetical protein